MKAKADLSAEYKRIKGIRARTTDPKKQRQLDMLLRGLFHFHTKGLKARDIIRRKPK